MGKKCAFCQKAVNNISSALMLCYGCICRNFDNAKPIIDRVHREVRKKYNLPEKAPSDSQGTQCLLCINECRIPVNGYGLCGIRRNEKGVIKGGEPENGKLSFYYDLLPTNCVADWVCAGGTGAGYPEFAYRNGAETGFKNLAVFYHACSFNCLFCQNWHYRDLTFDKKITSARTLADAVDEMTSCICYFGGDPTPQLLHAISSSEIAIDKKMGKVLRICFETNGSMNQSLLRKIIELSLKSGGCIKFDLKAYTEELNYALCGVSNRRSLENFKFAASYIKKRPEPPLLIASTLLIPGYVEEEEVRKIAGFIAGINPEIPYSLLAFYPQFCMKDLPVTSRNQALSAQEAAKKAGLKRVKIGNILLLS